jgi:hypothetical protein
MDKKEKSPLLPEKPFSFLSSETSEIQVWALRIPLCLTFAIPHIEGSLICRNSVQVAAKPSQKLIFTTSFAPLCPNALRHFVVCSLRYHWRRNKYLRPPSIRDRETGPALWRTNAKSKQHLKKKASDGTEELRLKQYDILQSFDVSFI